MYSPHQATTQKGRKKEGNRANGGTHIGTNLECSKEETIIGFADIEKIDEIPNDLPLVIIMGIHGHDVAKCMVDEGSFVDILYQDAFEELGLRKKYMEF